MSPLTGSAGAGRERLTAYAADSLRILKVSVELSRRDHPEFYRVIAAQLRLLLCDTTRQHGQIVDISLLGRLYPHLRLPLLETLGGGMDLPLLEWREQALPDLPDLTLRQLIRQVCDLDGGAHVDPRQVFGLVDYDLKQERILRTAELIIPIVEGLLQDTPGRRPAS